MRLPTFLLITGYAICIATLIILFEQPHILIVLFKQRTNRLTYSQQRLLYYSPTRIMGHYEAPLLSYDNPTRLPHQYIVFLRLGHSLEQHKQAVGNGTDLDSLITHAFPETERYGELYAAKMDDASFAAVRADVGVDLVQCEL